jgi:hypothetical protein
MATNTSSNGRDPAAGVVDVHGRTTAERRADEARCPICGAPPTKRVASSGFGLPHDVCGNCGHDFKEWTL